MSKHWPFYTKEILKQMWNLGALLFTKYCNLLSIQATMLAFLVYVLCMKCFRSLALVLLSNTYIHPIFSY